MNMKDLIYNERTGEFVPVDNTNNKSQRHLIYDERIGEFVPVNLINNKSQRHQSVQVSSINNIKLSTYYYIDGISHPYKGSEIVTMRLPRGTRIRKMLENEWFTIDNYISISNKNVSINDSYMDFDDSTYFYIEGEPHVYKWGVIKRMQLPKGTRVRKMLDDKWIILK